MNTTERKRIQKSFSRFDFQTAERYLRQLLKKNQRDLDVYYYLALCYDQAHVLKVYNSSGIRLYRSKALGILRAGFQLSPREPRLLHTRGLVFLHAGQPRKALHDFRRAYQYTKNPKYLLSIANALRRLDRPHLAISYYRRAQRYKNVSKVLIYHNLAATFQSIREITRARGEAHKGLALLQGRPLTPFDRIVQKELQQIFFAAHTKRTGTTPTTSKNQ